MVSRDSATTPVTHHERGELDQALIGAASAASGRQPADHEQHGRDEQPPRARRRRVAGAESVGLVAAQPRREDAELGAEEPGAGAQADGVAALAEEVPERGEVAGAVAQLLDHRRQPEHEQHRRAAAQDRPTSVVRRRAARVDRRRPGSRPTPARPRTSGEYPTWHCTTNVPAASAPTTLQRLPSRHRPHEDEEQREVGDRGVGVPRVGELPELVEAGVREPERAQHQQHERGARRDGTPPTRAARRRHPARARRRRAWPTSRRRRASTAARARRSTAGPGWLKPRLYAPTSGVWPVKTSRTQRSMLARSCTREVRRARRASPAPRRPGAARPRARRRAARDRPTTRRRAVGGASGAPGRRRWSCGGSGQLVGAVFGGPAWVCVVPTGSTAHSGVTPQPSP